jgi:hypothetical protein
MYASKYSLAVNGIRKRETKDQMQKYLCWDRPKREIDGTVL